MSHEWRKSVDIKAKEIRMVDPALLKLHERNPNEHPEEQIERLCKIIRYQGFRRPVTVSNQSGMVTVGNGRVMAAIKLGITKIPAIYQDYDNGDQEYADLVADNAIESWSSLNIGKINFELQNLGPDFDLETLGLKNFVLEPADKLDPNGEWAGMPEFNQADKSAFKTVTLHFYDQKGVDEFAAMINQIITEKTRTIWYPQPIIEPAADKVYGSES
jgi:hypothetical protein